MSLKDRGLKKWTAFMLPEHVEMMKEFDRDDFVQKPIIDEYMVQEFESKIQYAFESRCKIAFKVWREGFTEDVSGYVHRLDPFTKEIGIQDEMGRVKRVQFKDIIDMQVAE
jgi:YolD-like protein.